MNGKVIALGGFALVTTALMAWFVLGDQPPNPDEFDEQERADDDVEPTATAAPQSQRRRVRRQRIAATETKSEASPKIDLPAALPKLKVAEQTSEPTSAAPVEPPNEAPGPSAVAEQDAIVSQLARTTAARCLQEVQGKFPEARGQLMARLHLGPSDGGRVVVRNLELDQIGEVHPELLGCLDRELMRLDLDLPDGVERIVNAPLRLLKPGESESAGVGSVAPPPGYPAPPNEPHQPPPRTAEGAGEGLPPGVMPEHHLAPGTAVAPPDEAAPPPPMPPGAEPPPAGSDPNAPPPEMPPAAGDAPPR